MIPSAQPYMYGAAVSRMWAHVGEVNQICFYVRLPEYMTGIGEIVGLDCGHIRERPFGVGASVNLDGEVSGRYR